MANGNGDQETISRIQTYQIAFTKLVKDRFFGDFLPKKVAEHILINSQLFLIPRFFSHLYDIRKTNLIYLFYMVFCTDCRYTENDPLRKMYLLRMTQSGLQQSAKTRFLLLLFFLKEKEKNYFLCATF